MTRDAAKPKKPTKRQARKAERALCHLINLEGLIHEHTKDHTGIGEAMSTVCDALRAIEDAAEGRS